MELARKYIAAGKDVIAVDKAYGHNEKLATCVSEDAAHLIATALQFIEKAADFVGEVNGIFTYTGGKMSDHRL